MTGKWYALKSSDQDGEVELSIYDEIGAYVVGAKEFIAELRQHKGELLGIFAQRIKSA